MKGLEMLYRSPLSRLLTITVILLIGLAANIFVVHQAFAQDDETSPELPEVNIQAVLNRDGLEIGQTTQLNVIVTNKSNMALRGVSFTIVPGNFISEVTQELEHEITPFGGAQGLADIKPSESADFGNNTLIVILQYSWGEDVEFRSEQAVTVNVTVKRKFEDELGGLLSGGAAFLYFILPIYPAIAAYKIIETLRKGEGIKIPSVSLANLVPGAIASIAANMVIQPIIGEGDLLDIANYFFIIGASLIAGAIIPVAHWGWDAWQKNRWSYKEVESYVEILRKTLRRPRLPKPNNSWVKVTVGTESWEGYFLEAGKTTCVLGAVWQASVNRGDIEKIKQNVLNEQGLVLDSKRLIKLVSQGAISISPLERISHNGQRINDIIKIIETDCVPEVKKEVPFVKLVP